MKAWWQRTYTAKPTPTPTQTPTPMETQIQTPTLLDEANNKLKELEEAMALLDRLGGDIDWALDFCNYESINEHLSPLSYAIGEAHEEIEEMYERLSEEIENYKTNKAFADQEFEDQSDLKYLVE